MRIVEFEYRRRNAIDESGAGRRGLLAVHERMGALPAPIGIRHRVARRADAGVAIGGDHDPDHVEQPQSRIVNDLGRCRIQRKADRPIGKLGTQASHSLPRWECRT
jgi:hypothetical protein